VTEEVRERRRALSMRMIEEALRRLATGLVAIAVGLVRLVFIRGRRSALLVVIRLRRVDQRRKVIGLRALGATVIILTFLSLFLTVLVVVAFLILVKGIIELSRQTVKTLRKTVKTVSHRSGELSHGLGQSLRDSLRKGLCELVNTGLQAGLELGTRKWVCGL
jgi:ABC-type multidrug transport system fused ATPase/permease subunit